MPEDRDRAAAFAQMEELLGERFTTAAAVRDHHARDESWHPPKPPEAVCFPETTLEVAALIPICAAHSVPIVPFGAGTSLEGHLIPEHGGISIDLTRMNRIL